MENDIAESVFDYYMDYEFQVRMVENSIKGMGKDEPVSVLENLYKIKDTLNYKKVHFVFNKLVGYIDYKKYDLSKNRKYAYLKARDFIYGKIDIDTFIDGFVLKNKKRFLAEIRAAKENNKVTICYPLIERSGRKRIKRPVVTFNCIIEENRLKVERYCVNKESLLIILSYAQGISRWELECEYGRMFKSTYEKINSLDGQYSIYEILTLVDCEVFASFQGSKIKSLLDFKRHDYWEKLNRVFVTLDEFNELNPPIFRDEIKVCKEKCHKENNVPALLKEYIFGGDSQVEYKSIKDEFRFHYGSYTDEYPVNEKQWDIVTIADYNRLMSVNGPPGTGKTTLLKELIADNIVRKARDIIDVWNEDWTHGIKGVLVSPLGGKNNRSIIVTSTNNLAVDNIGLELLKEVPYFENFMADNHNGYRGIVCARLGKSSNIETFYNDQFLKFVEFLENIKEEGFSHEPVEKFNELWNELEKLKNKISIFCSKRKLFHKLFEINPLSNSEIDKEYDSYVKKLILQKNVLDREKSQIHSIKNSISSRKSTISEHRKTKAQLENAKNAENDNNRRLFENLEKYRTKSKNLFMKKILMLMSGYWKNFFKEFPSEDYIHNEINKSDGKIEKMELEIHNAELNIQLNEEEYKRLISQKNVVENNIRNTENMVSSLENSISEINSFRNSCKDIENALKIYDACNKSFYNLANCSLILKLRKQTFYTSLKVMQLYIMENKENFINNLKLIVQLSKNSIRWCKPFYSSSDEYSEKRKAGVLALWETFFICFPVVTTTLHSFRRDMLQMIPELLDLIMVDEAAQILPHYLCAPLYRAKKAIIVGDTNQLDPIRPMENDVIQNSNVPEELYDNICIENNSSQSYADRNCDVYEILNNNRTGIVLNEHRRCEEGIIEFSNKFIYENKLVVTRKDDNDKLFGSNLVSFDIRGIKGKYHFNRLEVHACKKIIDQYKDMYGNEVMEKIAVISPFKRQVDELKKEIDGVEIGTVHTFQGRQKDVVIFTTVIDDVKGSNRGLSDFIGARGNLLNVAFSRAVKQFIMVGNFKVLSQGSYFLRKAFDTISEHGKLYSFFNMDFHVDGQGQDEQNIKNWERAFNVLSAGDDAMLHSNNVLMKFIQKNCPGNIVFGSGDHYEILKAIIKLSRKNICIFSPWISDYVVDLEFLGLLEDAVKRNIKINICFGYKGKKIPLNSVESIKSILIENGGFYNDIENTAKIILYMEKKLGIKVVYSPPVHTKLLLVDDICMFIGSHNWLANSGKSDNAGYREMSCLVKSSDSIDYVKSRYINYFFYPRG